MKKFEGFVPGTRVRRIEEKSWGEVTRVRFEETDVHKLDSDGPPRKVRTIWENPDGSEIERCAFVYSDDGECVDEIWKWPDGSKKRRVHRVNKDGSSEMYFEDVDNHE